MNGEQILSKGETLRGNLLTNCLANLIVRDSSAIRSGNAPIRRSDPMHRHDGLLQTVVSSGEGPSLRPPMCAEVHRFS